MTDSILQTTNFIRLITVFLGALVLAGGLFMYGFSALRTHHIVVSYTITLYPYTISLSYNLRADCQVRLHGPKRRYSSSNDVEQPLVGMVTFSAGSSNISVCNQDGKPWDSSSRLSVTGPGPSFSTISPSFPPFLRVESVNVLTVIRPHLRVRYAAKRYRDAEYGEMVIALRHEMPQGK